MRGKEAAPKFPGAQDKAAAIQSEWRPLCLEIFYTVSV
jgi:hypothetical protein